MKILQNIVTRFRDDNLIKTLYKISLGCSIFVLCMGLLVISGWVLHVEILQRLAPSFPPMVFNTALGFSLSGIVLILQRGKQNQFKLLTTFLSIIVLLIGTLTLLEYIFSFNIGIEQLFFTDYVSQKISNTPGRPSSNTAITFMILGAILLLDNFDIKRIPIQVLAILPIIITLPPIISYLLGTNFLLGVSDYIGIAMHTAISFILSSIAILTWKPESGLTSIFVYKGLSGRLARRLFTTLLFLPIIIAIILIIGRELNFYSATTTSSIFIALNFLLFLAIFWISIQSLYNYEREANRNLQLYTSIAKNLPKGIVRILDTNLTYIYDEGEEIKKFDLAGENLVGKSIYTAYSKEHTDFLCNYYNRVLQGEKVTFEETYKDETFLVNTTPLYNERNEIESIMSLAINITPRKKNEENILKLNENLNIQTEQLQHLNEELESFSYSVSHDLRTPLRHIDGFIELLKKKASNLDEASQRYINIISESSRKMALLIDDLLQFSRIGRSEVNKNKINCNNLLKEILTEFDEEIKERDIKLSYTELPEIYADYGLLRLVWQNLISNAIKYTRKKESPEITISYSTEDSFTVFNVKDNGVGFEMDYYDKLFGVFHRLHNEKDFEGTGIGLANVHKIITKHGGDVWATGELNKGASFFFSIPINENEKAAGSN